MTIPFEKVKEQVMKNPEVLAHYEALKERYALIEGFIAVRTAAGLTQKEIAERMGTTQSVIARMEGGKVSPSVDTLSKYAHAVGVRPVISFEPLEESVST